MKRKTKIETAAERDATRLARVLAYTSKINHELNFLESRDASGFAVLRYLLASFDAQTYECFKTAFFTAHEQLPPERKLVNPFPLDGTKDGE